MRKLVVGDIHGGLRALKEVIEKIKPSATDVFIFVGDYVDGWSDNAETIRFLISFSKMYTCIFIKGNHDELLFNYLSGKEMSDMWLNHGGKSSVKSYSAISEEEKRHHIKFLKQLENFHIDADNNLFVHAGFTDQKGPQFEYFPNKVYWDRTLWEMVCALDTTIKPDDERYPKRLQLFNEIFIGHTPTIRIGRIAPTNFANVWNVDTGAAFTGALSVLDVKTKQVWQSTPVYKLYPEEKGRN